MMGKIELVAAVIASVCLSVMCVWMVYDAFAMEQTQEVKTSVTHPLGFEDQLEKDFKIC
jgi:putative Mn2+ efflux pump MntP